MAKKEEILDAAKKVAVKAAKAAVEAAEVVVDKAAKAMKEAATPVIATAEFEVVDKLKETLDY